MYERTFWLDHVEDQGGEVIQEGTPLDQAHFNKMEVGIEDANLAHKIVMIFARWIERRLAAIEGTSGTHTTDIAGIKAKDTAQDGRLTALESETAAEVKEVERDPDYRAQEHQLHGGRVC